MIRTTTPCVTARSRRRVSASLLAGVTAVSLAVSGIVAPKAFAENTDKGSIAETSIAVDNPASDGSDTVAAKGSVSWNFKDSFIKYLRGMIANGSITTDGKITKGSEVNDPFIFSLDSDNAVVTDADTAVFPVEGTIRFTGHGGALDTQLSDITFAFDGSTAQCIVDYSAKQYPSGDIVEKDDVVIATFTLDKPYDATAKDTVLTGDGVLAEDGVDAFNGEYEAGTELAPATFTFGDGAVDVSGGVHQDPQYLTDITGIMKIIGGILGALAAGGLAYWAYTAIRQGTITLPFTIPGLNG